MKPVNAYNVSSLQVARGNVLINKIDGLVLTTSNNSPVAYLQVHDSIATPAAAAVPLKQWPVYSTAEIFKDFRRDECNCTLGCFVGLSSADGTYVADSTTKIDISVELSDPELPTGTSLVGDLTTAVNTLQIWTEASNTARNKRLFTLEVDGTSHAADFYIMLFAKDSNTNGDFPILGWKCVNGVSLNRTLSNGIDFGTDGFDPFSRATSGGTARVGCTIEFSSTATTLTKIAATDFVCRAKVI